MFGRVAACAIAASLLIVPTVTSGEVYPSADAPSADAHMPATTILLVTNHGQTEVRRGDWSQDQSQDQTHQPAQADTQAQENVATLDPAEPSDTSPAVAAPTIPSPAVAEPFGLKTVPVASGELLTKWNGVEADIRAESDILARCRESAQHCPSAAQNFLAIIAAGRAHTGRARIGVINRAINLAIRPMSDLAQWGVIDKWSAPLETLTTGLGDCEDYAIAKYVALTEAGVAAEDVRLVIVRNLVAGVDHAVVAARLDGDWIILDNRRLRLVEDSEMREVVPLFVLDQNGVRLFWPTTPSRGVASAPASLEN